MTGGKYRYLAYLQHNSDVTWRPTGFCFFVFASAAKTAASRSTKGWVHRPPTVTQQSKNVSHISIQLSFWRDSTALCGHPSLAYEVRSTGVRLIYHARSHGDGTLWHVICHRTIRRTTHFSLLVNRYKLFILVQRVKGCLVRRERP